MERISPFVSEFTKFRGLEIKTKRPTTVLLRLKVIDNFFITYILISFLINLAKYNITNRKLET